MKRPLWTKRSKLQHFENSFLRLWLSPGLVSNEGRWVGKIELERIQMMKLARSQGMSKTDAQAWVYAEFDRMYPLVNKEDSVLDAESSTLQRKEDNVLFDKHIRNFDDGQIQELSRIPDHWPKIPANASLSAESDCTACSLAGGQKFDLTPAWNQTDLRFFLGS